MKASTGKVSEVQRKCLEVTQACATLTLFSPVTQTETVQAMRRSYLDEVDGAVHRVRSASGRVVRQRVAPRWARGPNGTRTESVCSFFRKRLFT
jgi:hypothetical protein